MSEAPFEESSPGKDLITSALIDLYTVPETYTHRLPVRREGKIVYEDISFNVLIDNADYNQAQEHVKEVVGGWINAYDQGVLNPALFREHFVPDQVMLARVALLSHLAKDKEWKDHVSWLVLARKASPVFMAIYNGVTLAAVPSLEQLQDKEFVAEKKDSSATGEG